MARKAAPRRKAEGREKARKDEVTNCRQKKMMMMTARIENGWLLLTKKQQHTPRKGAGGGKKPPLSVRMTTVKVKNASSKCTA